MSHQSVVMVIMAKFTTPLEEEEEEADDVADQHGSGTAPEADDDENDEDENNEGKRARSTADQKTNTPGHTSSIEGELQEGVIPPGSAPKKPLLVIGKRRLFARRVTRHVSWSCPICDVSFKKEAQMVSHLASREHWQQSKNHPDHSDLIFQFGSALVTQSLFKCSICSFYCNSHEDFLRHWGSPQELHAKNLEQHGGFHCVPCNYECWKANDMEEHLKDTAHTTSLSPINPLEVRASSLRCPKCEWTTDKYRALQSHIKLAHAAKAFFHCNICQEDFAEHETLLEHWKADDHWSKCHKCMHCSFVTDRLPRLVVHLRTVHKDDSKLQTALPTSVNNNQDVQNKPNVPISTIVTISKEDTMLEEEAENSIMSENNENSRETAYNKKFRKPLNTVHLCMFCGSKQDNGLSMKEHVTRHHPEKLIRCLPCCATFVFESQYQKHLASRVHQCNVMGENDESSSGNQLYACDQCPFQCRNHAGILFHQTMHAGPVSEEIAAIHEEMQNALKQENEAAKMLLVSKTSDAEFLQDVTTGEAGEDDDDDDDDAGQPQGAEDSNGMDRGKMIKKKKQSRKKRPDRLYCCPLCDKMFTPFRLRIHLNVHTGECPFVCTICGMSYTRKDSLYSHHRNTHKEKQYACPQCPYRSSRKGKINEHILTHKVRPRKFLCDTCGAGFYKK